VSEYVREVIYAICQDPTHPHSHTHALVTCSARVSSDASEPSAPDEREGGPVDCAVDSAVDGAVDGDGAVMLSIARNNPSRPLNSASSTSNTATGIEIAFRFSSDTPVGVESGNVKSGDVKSVERMKKWESVGTVERLGREWRVKGGGLECTN